MIRWRPVDFIYSVIHFFVFVTLLGITSYNPYVVVAEGFLLFFHGMVFATVGVLEGNRQRAQWLMENGGDIDLLIKGESDNNL